MGVRKMILTINIPKRGQKITNGDVIKAMFPNIECKKEGIVVSVKYLDSNKGALLNERHFWADWWNAPYNPQQNLSYTDKSGANIASQDVLRSAT
jgi:hypothetical protein